MRFTPHLRCYGADMSWSSFILAIMLLAQGDTFSTAFSEVTVVACQEGKPINFVLPAQHKIVL
jgi:hypothetical protein